MKKVLFAFAAATALIFAACKGASSSDPKASLTSFFTALSKKDLKEARKYATKESESMLSMMEMALNMAKNMKSEEKDEFDKFGKENMEIGEAVIDGDKATVPVKNKKDNESTNFILRKQDGAWKVAFDKATMAEMAGEKMKESGDQMPANMDSLNQVLQSLNSDSLKNAVNESVKAIDSLTKTMKVEKH